MPLTWEQAKLRLGVGFLLGLHVLFKHNRGAASPLSEPTTAAGSSVEAADEDFEMRDELDEGGNGRRSVQDRQ